MEMLLKNDEKISFILKSNALTDIIKYNLASLSGIILKNHIFWTIHVVVMIIFNE